MISSSNPLELPVVVQRLFKHLPILDILQCASVSKTWRDVSMKLEFHPKSATRICGLSDNWEIQFVHEWHDMESIPEGRRKSLLDVAETFEFPDSPREIDYLPRIRKICITGGISRQAFEYFRSRMDYSKVSTADMDTDLKYTNPEDVTYMLNALPNLTHLNMTNSDLNPVFPIFSDLQISIAEFTCFANCSTVPDFANKVQTLHLIYYADNSDPPDDGFPAFDVTKLTGVKNLFIEIDCVTDPWGLFDDRHEMREKLNRVYDCTVIDTVHIDWMGDVSAEQLIDWMRLDSIFGMKLSVDDKSNQIILIQRI